MIFCRGMIYYAPTKPLHKVGSQLDRDATLLYDEANGTPGTISRWLWVSPIHKD